MYNIIKIEQTPVVTPNTQINNGYNNNLDLNMLKNNTLTLGNLYENGFSLSIRENENEISYYYAKAYPTANNYNIINLNFKFKYRLTYTFNPYYYLNNGYILYSSQGRTIFPYFFSNGFKFNLNNKTFISSGIKININNNDQYSTPTNTENNHVIFANGGSYNNNPTTEDFFTLNYDITNYKPIYTLGNYNTNTYLWSKQDLTNIYKFTTPVYDKNINQTGEYFVNYKENNINLYLGWYQGERNTNYWFDNGTIPGSYNLSYYPSLSLFNGVNYNTYTELKNDNTYRTKILGVYDNNFIVSDTFYPIYTNVPSMQQSSNNYMGSTRDLSERLVRSNGIITNELMQILPFNYLVETTKQYNVTHISRDKNLVNDNLGIYNYNYSLATKENVNDYVKPLYKDFEITNTLYFNDLNQINLSASALDLSYVKIIGTETSPIIRDTFNTTMQIALGSTATITTIVSAIFLFRAVVALFRSNK